MVQSPSWEANRFATSQEIPRISRNPKVHYRTHNRPPHVSIPGQPNTVHIPTSHLLQIRPNIIHPSTPRSPQWSHSLRFPHQDPIHPPLLTHTRHMPSPPHSSRFYHPHNIGWVRSTYNLDKYYNGFWRNWVSGFCPDSGASAQGQIAICCDHCHITWGSIKGGNFLTNWATSPSHVLCFIEWLSELTGYLVCVSLSRLAN